MEQNFYEVLEVGSDATVQQIERAYRIQRATYQPASTATYSVFSDDENAEILRRVEESYAVLSDSRMRREYDARLRSEGVAAHTLPTRPAPAPAPPVPEPETWVAAEENDPDAGFDEPEDTADEVYDGRALRRLRIKRGVELDEIASSTKINARYLEFIENNRYEKLPSPVYLRGFLKQVARFLKLDPGRVVDGYMDRYEGRGQP